MKDNIVKQGMKNTVYVFFAQMVSYGLSFLTSFILPGFLGVTPYAYYQVYVFYTSYVGLLHFGFADGIYLRFGSFDYSKFPKKLFRSFILFLTTFDFIILLFFIFIASVEKDPCKRFAYYFSALNIVVINLNTLFNYINQISGRIKKYSFVVVAEKVQIIIAIILLIFAKQINFKYVIAVDFIAKLIVLLINIYNCRELIFGKRVHLKSALPECFENFNVGIKLMLANFMGMLVMGLGKFILEKFGTVSDFGLYSFAVSSTNLAMMFVTSVSMILYPILCRIDKNNLPRLFSMLNQLLCSIIFVMLLMYYPLIFVVHHWLTKYVPILNYLYLLFPIVIMSSKMELLINTFYKSLREEKAMLKANMSSVIMFLVIAVPIFFYNRSILTIVWATLITFVWRCYASEIYLKKRMGIKYMGNIFQEIMVAIVFIISTGLLKGIAGLCLYVSFVTLYFILNRRLIIKYTKKIAFNLTGIS